MDRNGAFVFGLPSIMSRFLLYPTRVHSAVTVIAVNRNVVYCQEEGVHHHASSMHRQKNGHSKIVPKDNIFHSRKTASNENKSCGCEKAGYIDQKTTGVQFYLRKLDL
jgi:hypothetical protein